MRDGITYPRAIPRDDPAIARALANAISFFHGNFGNEINAK